MSEQQRPQEQQQQAAQGPEELTEVARMLRDAAAQLRSIIDSLNNPLAAIAASAMQPAASGQAGVAQQGTGRGRRARRGPTALDRGAAKRGKGCSPIDGSPFPSWRAKAGGLPGRQCGEGHEASGPLR